MLQSKQQMAIAGANKQFLTDYFNRLDEKVLNQINEKYLSQLNELQELMESKFDKTTADKLKFSSTHTYLWSQGKQDLCKRIILYQVVNDVISGKRSQPDFLDMCERLWTKLKDQYGKRDTYPKPYCKMSEQDHHDIHIMID